MSLLNRFIGDVKYADDYGNLTNGEERLRQWGIVSTGTEDVCVPISPHPAVNNPNNPDAVSVNKDEKNNLVVIPSLMPNWPYCPVFADRDPATDSIHYTVYVVGGIVEIGEYASVLSVLSSLRENDTITSYLDSGGGNLLTGSALAAALKETRGQTLNVATGVCASATSLYFVEGKSHAVSPFADVMFHMSSHADYGSSTSIKKNADRLTDYVSKILLPLAVEKGFLLEDEYKRIVHQDETIWISSAIMNDRMTNKSTPTDVSDRPELSAIGVESLITDLIINRKVSAGLEDIRLQDNFELPDYLTNKLGESSFAGIESYNGTTIPVTNSNLADLSFEDMYRTLVSMGNKNLTVPEYNTPMPNAAVLQRKFTLFKVRTTIGQNGEVCNYYVTTLDDAKEFWNPRFKIAFMRALDMLTENDRLDIILPGGILPGFVTQIGGILSALDRCKGHIVTHMSGLGDIVDSAIWLMGKDRRKTHYGQLRFNAEILKFPWILDSCRSTITGIMNKLGASGLVSEDDITGYFKEYKDISIT